MVVMQGTSRKLDSILAEKSTSTTTSRILEIYGITSYSELENVLLDIKSNNIGTSAAIAINVNNLGNKSLKVINNGIKQNPSKTWSYSGQVYSIYYDGTDFILFNTLGVEPEPTVLQLPIDILNLTNSSTAAEIEEAFGDYTYEDMQDAISVHKQILFIDDSNDITIFTVEQGVDTFKVFYNNQFLQYAFTVGQTGYDSVTVTQISL